MCETGFSRLILEEEIESGCSHQYKRKDEE